MKSSAVKLGFQNGPSTIQKLVLSENIGMSDH